MKQLPVIQTQNLLYKFVQLCEEQSGRGASNLQCEIICAPLIKLSQGVTAKTWQYELLRQGLFESTEWSSLENTVKEMESKNVWKIVKQEYKLLRSLWNGPRVSIYIFPMKKRSQGEQILNKNGVAYRNAIFLFLSPDLPPEEIKALFAHEYNHVCRLNYLDLSPDKISLMDSLVIEGLGEYAVKELYGKKYLAPWVSLYTFEEAIDIWKKHFVPSLSVKGVSNHQLFLYGRGRGPFPKWIGYHLGYQIVQTFQENQGKFKKSGLYTKSSKEIIAGSDFPIS